MSPGSDNKLNSSRFVRLAEKDRRPVTLYVNGEAVEALEGDTLLVAILTVRDHLRMSEFGDGRRAGFCLMGSCQDCWITTESGDRLKACATSIAAGMRVRTDSESLK